MKPGRSPIVAEFLFEVLTGNITATNPHAQQSLDAVCDALDAIWHGESPDDALGIERHSGRGKTGHRFADQMGAAAYKMRQDNQTWDAITLQVAEWMEREGEPPIPRSTLQELVKKRKSLLESRAKRAARRKANKGSPEE